MARASDNIYKWRKIIDEAYATMDDGPEDYLFRKDGKQKLVGSVDNLPEDDVCPACDGIGELYTSDKYGEITVTLCKKCKGSGSPVSLEEDDAESYRYRDEVDYEEDNSKIWHYGKAPNGEWEVIDRSPYADMNDVAWPLYVDFHKKHGRWPTQQESYKIEELERQLWDQQK